MEDLDALVDDENRSFFLNQLDGFEKNHGLIVLATTNHPERIDAAIINRPSRFDRRYHFHLPSLPQRIEYLQYWQCRLAEQTGWSEAKVQPVAADCDEFSFAYIKELVISSVMKWMQGTDHNFVEIARDQAKMLRRQMKTETNG
ncbi:MAG: ATP-binding protein [Planctomycetota bacterium]